MRSRSVRLSFAAALCVTAAHYASFYSTARPLVTDVRYFVYLAWRVANGAVPHLDYFENKTQLASLVGGLLYALADLVGEPLPGLRIAYLTLAAAVALLGFSVHRRIAPEHPSAGFLGALALCAFPLLGFLPSVGVIPKLLMAGFASLVGLCVHRRWWFAAGVASALSFLDWQVGALSGLAAGACALISESGRASRQRAAGSLALGALAGLAPLAIYYALNGALGASLEQVFASSFVRGSTALAATSTADRAALIAQRVAQTGPHATALFYASWAGLPLALLGCWQRRGTAAGRLLLALTLHHAGVAAFSLVDFQAYGDLFILLHSAAFFLAIALVGLLALATRALRSRAGEARATALASAVVAIATLFVVRPEPLAPDHPIPVRRVAPGTTLADQRDVAQQVAAELGHRRLVFFQHVEIAYLMGYANPLPYFYWNAAAWGATRRGDEGERETALRVLLEFDADAFTVPWPLPNLPPRYRPRDFRSASGRYQARFFVAPPAPG